ncbi:hypothetical protein I4F81_011751 [Pyropia yezoensis]|uniref:Uncharacterized protein n=1 Tax=Pyropia yezoensis TaxID=2788 RepID=A0ACC3CGE6_PYRYE|nr:hypothetical protein I4F81_011751 [Neopyropia yezoensis]
MPPCSQPTADMEPREETTVWGTYWATGETVPAVSDPSDLMHPGMAEAAFTSSAAHVNEHLDVPPSYSPHDLWSPVLSSSGVCHRGGPYLSEDSLGLPRTPPLPVLLSPLTSERAPGIKSSQEGSCTEGGGSLTDNTAGVTPQQNGETGGDGSNAAPTQPVNDAVVHMASLAKHFHVPRKEAAAAMGICVTILKRRCRSVGIMAWPYRKMAMVEKRIQLRETMLLDGSADLTAESSEALKAEILVLRERMALLRRNPNLKSSDLV